MPSETPAIYWFRQDLRLSDLPALNAAIRSDQPLIACFVLDDEAAGDFQAGGAGRWWLHHSLASLSDEIDELGGQLHFRSGNTGEELAELAKQTSADTVFCSRAYEPWASKLEREVHDSLDENGITLKRFAGSLLYQPEDISTGSGTPYKVYSPFWRACLKHSEPPEPQRRSPNISFAGSVPAGPSLNDLALRPGNPDWAEGWTEIWEPGAHGADLALRRFLDSSIEDYKEGRDHPAREATSQLSPHLHFGEISPRQVWHAVSAAVARNQGLSTNGEKFKSELGWREFNYHLLFHFPHICEKPFNSRFSDFPWRGKKELLQAWQRGETGYPIVDAGMRQLWQTGYMHNRVRMICASFLTKHLLTHWRKGERWFWDTLVDADAANNLGGWQWAAGCGADAAPYFRIFNPTLQSKKFDSEGSYVRRWVPELSKLPDKHLHEPAAAPAEVLKEADVTLGVTYPHPIVDHKEAREAALAAYEAIKDS